MPAATPGGSKPWAAVTTRRMIRFTLNPQFAHGSRRIFDCCPNDLAVIWMIWLFVVECRELFPHNRFLAEPPPYPRSLPDPPHIARIRCRSRPLPNFPNVSSDVRRRGCGDSQTTSHDPVPARARTCLQLESRIFLCLETCANNLLNSTACRVRPYTHHTPPVARVRSNEFIDLWISPCISEMFAYIIGMPSHIIEFALFSHNNVQSSLNNIRITFLQYLHFGIFNCTLVPASPGEFWSWAGYIFLLF